MKEWFWQNVEKDKDDGSDESVWSHVTNRSKWRENRDGVNTFEYLGSQINDQDDDGGKMRRRIAVAKNAVVALTTLYKDKAIRLATKPQLLK